MSQIRIWEVRDKPAVRLHHILEVKIGQVMNTYDLDGFPWDFELQIKKDQNLLESDAIGAYVAVGHSNIRNFEEIESVVKSIEIPNTDYNTGMTRVAGVDFKDCQNWTRELFDLLTNEDH